MEEAHLNYYNFLNTNDEGAHEVGAAEAVAVADEVIDHELVAPAPTGMQGSRMKDFIIVVLMVVIVKLMFFWIVYDHEDG